MDLSKLTPAPWDNVGGDVFSTAKPGGEMVIADAGMKDDDAAFVALARNAFDVMLRRGWGTQRGQGNDDFGLWFGHPVPTRLLHMRWPDPFTALVEADRWYVENVEKQPQTT